MSAPFLALALISVAIGIVSFIAITAYVSRHGVKVNYFLWREMMFKYFDDYKAMTRKETGSPGVWYYTFVVAMILALAFVVVGVAVK